LTGRTQFTEICSTTSSIKDITYGVPQGSILGPLLFLIYVNDLPSSTSLNLLSFADDTTVYHSSPNLRDTFGTINTELTKMYIWLCENKLLLNISKTKFMIFGPQNSVIPNAPQLKINNQLIAQVGNTHNEKSIKFLGVYLDEHLTWKNHINATCNKMSRSLFAINQAKKFLPMNALRTLYFSLIHSQIFYGIEAWGNSSSFNKVTNLQKRAVRIIHLKPYRHHTDPLFKSSYIMKAIDVYKSQVMLIAYKYKFNKLPISFIDFYPNPTSSNIVTRQHNNIYLRKARTKFSSSSIYHKIPIIWNSLENNLKDILKYNKFKSTIKTSFISEYQGVVICNNPRCHQCA